MQAADDGVIARFQALRSSGDPAIREELITRFGGLALACARRFSGRGEPIDDLEQVAAVGLVKAVDRFDPQQGYAFSTFAVPTIMGELRRHFRDAGWAVRVPRRTKDLHVRLPEAVEELTRRLARTPRTSEVAEHLGVTEEAVLEAMDAAWAYRPLSLDSPVRGNGEDGPAELLGDTLGDFDPDALGVERRVQLAQLMGSLDERERRIIFLRFFEELSQSEIAALVGTSQVHVSRLIRASLERMRGAAQEVGST